MLFRFSATTGAPPSASRGYKVNTPPKIVSVTFHRFSKNISGFIIAIFYKKESGCQRQETNGFEDTRSLCAQV